MTDEPVARTTLLNQTLPQDSLVSHVEVRRITIAPSVAAGVHIHNCPVFGSIEKGSVVFQVGDEPEIALGAGDVFYEPANVVISRFDATDEGVIFLGYFLLGADETPEIDFLAG